MTRFTRAAVALMAVIIGLSVAGCIHTLTETYRDYPPSITRPPMHPEENPNDG
jgi:hypothetical protein